MNRPYDRDRRNPYDEPEEVFDAWVSNLESTIAAALHPPRKTLFPDPEPVYQLPAPKANGVRNEDEEADTLFYPTRPSLQTRTTSYTEKESDEEEEEGWPLPAALRDATGRRRSGGEEVMMMAEEDEEEDEDESMSEEEEEEDDMSEDEPTFNASPQPQAGSTVEDAQVISDSDDEPQHNQAQGSASEEEEEDEVEAEYDEEDEEEDDVSDNQPSFAPPPPAQYRNAAVSGQNLPGFSSAREQLPSRVEESQASEVTELSDSDDEERPSAQQQQANGVSHERDSVEADSWDEEEEGEEEEEQEEQSFPRRRDPFASQTLAFPPRPTQASQSPSVTPMEEEDEDQLERSGSNRSDSDSDELDPAESSQIGEEEEADDEITSFVPAVEEPTSAAVQERERTPTLPSQLFNELLGQSSLESSRDGTLSPVSAAVRASMPAELLGPDGGFSFDQLDTAASSTPDERVQHHEPLGGLAAFLDHMEPPQLEQQPSFESQMEIDPSLLDSSFLQGEGVDLNADQLGRPLFEEDATEVVERDGDLEDWSGEAGEEANGFDMDDFLKQQDDEDSEIFPEEQQKEIVVHDSLDPAAPPPLAQETKKAEDIEIDEPSLLPTVAEPPSSQALELELKAKLRQRLLDAKASRQRSPPPPPSSSTWKPSPNRPYHLPFDSQASSSTLPIDTQPDEFELEHQAAIQPHLPAAEPTPAVDTAATSVLDEYEKEHEAAIQPSSDLPHHSSEHSGIGPSPFVDDGKRPVFQAPSVGPAKGQEAVNLVESDDEIVVGGDDESETNEDVDIEVVDDEEQEEEDDDEIEFEGSRETTAVELNDDEKEEEGEDEEEEDEEEDDEEEMEYEGLKKETAVELDDSQDDEVEVHQPKVEEVSTPSPASFTDEAIQIASASPAPESASLDPSASPAVEATSPPYSPQPFASSDDVQIEEMEGQQDETMPEADVEPVASVVVEEQQELEETAESALARQSQSHVVRNALSAISEQAQKEREVVLGDPVEMHELEKDEQAKEDEPVPTGAADFIAFGNDDEENAGDQDTGASSPLFFPPSSPEDSGTPLPAPLEDTPARSWFPMADVEEPKPPAVASPFPSLGEPVVALSPTRILPGVIKAGLWDKDTFPPFSSPLKVQKQEDTVAAETSASSSIVSPPPAGAELPKPRAAPAPPDLITTAIPVAEAHTDSSSVADRGHTRPVTPAIEVEEKPDYDVNDSDRQPMDLDEAVERILEADEEFASDIIPLEDVAEPFVLPAYVEPETPPQPFVPCGPASPGFSPVSTFSDLPNPALSPLPTSLGMPPVERELSVSDSLVSEPSTSRARTPPAIEGVAGPSLNLGDLEDKVTTVTIPVENEVASLRSRARSDSRSSAGSLDYGLDASPKSGGDSDDDVVGILEARSEKDEELAEEESVSLEDEEPTAVDAEEEGEERDQLVALPSQVEAQDFVLSSDLAEEEAAPTADDQSGPSPPRPNPFARTVAPSAGLAPTSSSFPSTSPSSSFLLPSEPVTSASAPVFDEPQQMEGVSPGEVFPSRASASSSRSLSFHVHSSRSSRPGTYFSNPNAVASSSRPLLPAPISRPPFPVAAPPSLPSAVASISARSPSPVASTSQVLPLSRRSPTKSPAPASAVPRALSSPEHQQQQQQQPSQPNSPVTRSQCVYHLLRIPGPASYSETMIFVVPYCSLALVDAIKEENARVLGKASDEENERRRPIAYGGASEVRGGDRVLIGEEMEQKLTRICGIDLVRGGDCFYLRSVPREEEDGIGDDASSDDEAAAEPSSSPTKKPTSSTTRSKPPSAGKRKRPSQEHAAYSHSGHSSSDEEVKPEKKTRHKLTSASRSSPGKRRSPRRSGPEPEEEDPTPELVVEEEPEVAEEEKAVVMKRKRDEDDEEAGVVKEASSEKKKKGGGWGWWGRK